MVEIRTPRLSPTVRPAGQVSTATASSLYEAGSAVQGVADKFSRYYEEKAAEEAELIWTQAEVDWARRFKEGAKTAKDGFTGKTMEEYDAYVADAMKTVPLRQVGNMEHNFSKYRIGLEAKALEAEAAARARARAAAKAKIRDNRGHAMLEDSSYVTFRRLSDGLPDEEKRFLLDIWKTSVLNSNDPTAIETFRRIVDDGDEFDYLLTPKEKQGVLIAIDGAQKSFAKTAIKEHEAIIDEALKQSFLTGDFSTAEYLADEMANDPALMGLGDKLADKVRENIKLKEKVHAIGNMSLEEIAQETARRAAAITDDEVKPGEAENYTDWVAALDNHKNALKNPVDYASRRNPHVRRLEIEAAQAGDDPRTPANERAVATERYFDALNEQFDLWGLPAKNRRYLRPDEAQKIASSLNAMESGMTGPTGEAMLAVWGDARTQILKELVAGGLNNFSSFQIWRYDSPQIADIMARAKNADHEENAKRYSSKTSDSDYTSLRDKFYKTLAEYEIAFGAGRGSDAQNFIQSMTDTAFKAYVNYVVAEKGTMSPEDFIKLAYPEKTLVEPNAIMILPDNVDPDMVNRKTEILLENALTDLVQNISEELRDRIAVEENREIDDNLMALFLQNGKGTFILNDDHTGVRLAYNLNGLLVPLNPEFTFQELNLYYQERTTSSELTGKIIPVYRGLDDPNLRKDVEAGKITSTTRIKVGDKEITYTPPAKGADYRKAFQ
jgi:hypothetical protein